MLVLIRDFRKSVSLCFGVPFSVFMNFVTVNSAAYCVEEG
jgi:hypothetical protein